MGDESLTLGGFCFCAVLAQSFGPTNVRTCHSYTDTFQHITVVLVRLQKIQTFKSVPVDWTSSHPHGQGPWWEQEVSCSEVGFWKLLLGF